MAAGNAHNNKINRMTMPQYEGSSLAQYIAAHIATQIIQGELLEGERIQELRIADELNVSRGSVREALLLLERTHLIAIFPRRGAIVTEMSTEQVTALFETVALILGQMAANMSRDLNLVHKQYCSRLNQQLHGHVLHHEIQQFYDDIFLGLQECMQPTRDLYLAKFYQELLPSIQRCYFLTLNCTQQALEQSEAAFKLVIAAILSQNSQQATLFMYDFCRHLQQLVLQSLTRMKQIELAWATRSRR